MKRKALPFVLAGVVVLLFVFLIFFSTPFLIWLQSSFYPKPTGEKDKTSEWNYRNLINQELVRGKNWQQIVRSSPFQIVDTGRTEGPRQHAVMLYGSYPNIDGSTVCIPMAAEFARQHLQMNDYDARQIAIFSTTANAYDNLIQKTKRGSAFLQPERVFEPKMIDLIIVTEPSDDELEQARTAGVTLVVEPVCWDAFVFITHKNNPVNSLTVEQIQKIYAGEITNWSEVGGLDQEIVAYQREPNSGSQTTMEKQVMNGLPMLEAPMAKIVYGMGQLVEEVVSEYVNEQYSLGYTFKYYVDTLYVNDKIKVIAIEGIAPSDENIRNNSYPFCANYFAVYRAEDADGVAGQFVAWMLSEEGQCCIAQAGYIPLR